MGTRKKWTDEQHAILKDMAGKYSSSLIADKINAVTGSSFSRSAIIGAMDRMNFPGRPRVRAANVVRLPRAKIKPAISKARVAAPKPQPIRSLNIPFADLLPGQCLYATSPHTDSVMLFCGHPNDGSSYCSWHHSVTTEKPGSRVSSFRRWRYSDAAEQRGLGISAQG